MSQELNITELRARAEEQVGLLYVESLALINHLEKVQWQLEQQTSTVKTLAERNIELTVNLKLSERLNESFARDVNDLTGQLVKAEHAEQQVARVREACESDAYDMHKDYGNGELAVPVDSIMNALDGDGRGE